MKPKKLWSWIWAIFFGAIVIQMAVAMIEPVMGSLAVIAAGLAAIFFVWRIIKAIYKAKHFR